MSSAPLAPNPRPAAVGAAGSSVPTSARAPSAQADTPAAALTPTKATAGRRAWSLLKTVFNFLIEQWFVLGIGIVILLAHFFPNLGRTGGIIKAEVRVASCLSPAAGC